MKAQSMIVTTLENKLKRIKANMKKFDTICFAMLFVIIIMAGVMVWAFVYVPRFSANISENSADWGNFGQFFWGLGTMLFTALNVVVLLFVNKELRKYNDKQQEHQDKLKLQIEENRKQIQLEILRQKRIDNWLNNYYQLVLQLVNNRLNSDAEWLKILRNLTIIYKSMINDGLWGDKDNPQHLAPNVS